MPTSLAPASAEMQECIDQLIRRNSADYVAGTRGRLPTTPTSIAPPEPNSSDTPTTSDTATSGTSAESNSEKINEILGKNIRENAAQAARGAITSSGRVAIDQYGVARFLTHIGMKYVPVRLDGQDFRDICQRIAFETTGKPLSKDTITALVEVLRAQAVQSGARVQVQVRVASRISKTGGRNYIIDLANAAGEIVLVNSVGWKVAHNKKIAFLGGGGTLPIPIEPESLDVAYQIVREFLERAGVPPEFVLIVTAVLCEWFRADTAHPVLNIIGPAGGGKSSLARAIISVIDPTASGKLPEVKIEEEHIAASAQSRHVLVADNASHLSRDAQDILCRCVYGFETSQRRLYTQTEVERLPVHNPVIITSILPAITAPDLHDRALRIAFKPRRQFKSQAVLAESLDRERAEVLGALLTLLSRGMAHIDATQVSTHRLVDFVLVGDGIATALGQPRGHFSSVLTEASRNAASDYAAGDDLIIAIQRVLKTHEALAAAAETLPPQSSWTGGSSTIKRWDGTFRAVFRAAALHTAITRATPPDNSATYPRTARGLASALDLKLPVLSALGIKTEKRVFKRGPHTVWAFEWR